MTYTRISTQIIFYAAWVVDVFLGLRFIFKLLAANAGAPFTSFVYSVSGFFLAPFRGIFPVSAQGGSIFESSVLVAMLIYGLIAYGLLRLFEPSHPYVCDEMTGICRKVEA